MECSEPNEIINGISIGFDAVSFFMCIPIIIYLWKKRLSIPYICLHSYWIMVFLLIECICIISSLVQASIDIGKLVKILFFYVNLFGLKWILLIPLIAHSFSTGQALKYNYYHLTSHIYKVNNRELLNSNKYSKFWQKKYRYISISFLFLVPIIFVTVIYASNKNCLILNTNNIIVITIFLIFFFAIYVFSLARIWRYKISNDQFLLLFETISLFLVFVVETNIIFIHFYQESCCCINEICDTQFFSLTDSIFYFLKIAVIGISTLVRSHRYSNPHNLYFDNIDTFLLLKINFQMFAAFIKNKEPTKLILLKFWTDYANFKRIDNLNREDSERIANKRPREEREDYTRTTSEKLILHNGEEDLKKQAIEIYTSFFQSQSNNSSSSQEKKSSISLDFPADVRDKINEIYHQTKFNIEELGTIFDDAFNWIKNEIEKVFQNFKQDEVEMEKLMKIAFFEDLLFIPSNS